MRSETRTQMEDLLLKVRGGELGASAAVDDLLVLLLQDEWGH